MPTTSRTVGNLAAELPQCIPVFQRYGIDFWCGGLRTLENACLTRGIDPLRVLAEIRERSRTLLDEDCWTDRPLEELTEHIIAHYHDPHRAQLPVIEEMAEEVARVHGADGPARLGDLRATIEELREELEPHMLREERLFFGWIANRESGVAQAIDLMLDDHEGTSDQLERIRAITQGYQPPEEADRTWRMLCRSLEEFDRAMQMHIHLENNVLFRRALAHDGAWFRG